MFSDGLEVLLVGDPGTLRLREVAADIKRVLDRPVNPTVVTPARWKAGDDGFGRTMRIEMEWYARGRGDGIDGQF